MTLSGIVADVDRRIGQVDAAVEKTTDRGHGKAATAPAEDQRRNRAELAATRLRETKARADLKVEKAMVDDERQRAEADLGPVRYLATLLGSTDEASMRLLILVVALLLDPAAVLPLLAATRQGP
jgi:hypothetical protein